MISKFSALMFETYHKNEQTLGTLLRYISLLFFRQVILSEVERFVSKPPICTERHLMAAFIIGLVNNKLKVCLYAWFAKSSPKIYINDFLTKYLHNVNGFITFLQVSCQYTSKYKSYSCSKFGKSLCIYITAAMLVDKRMPASPFSHIT